MKFSLVIIALALTISCCNSKTEITAKKVRPDYYPSNNSWEKLSLRDAGCDKKLFKIMEKRLSEEKQINAVVILRNGYRVYEYNGYPVFFAWGAREQYIFVVPDLQLVAVFASAYSGTPAMTPPEYMREYVIAGCN
ncbi:MAG TPA: hypothetical protein P5123_09415 [Spirochaetota bacterium]|nr:hypothetical protein [Spirochaetota bacterium]